MNRERFDVVVVGAGPAGSTAARLCAENGLSTCLIEEHGAAGYPVQCAGLLSSSAFRECEVSEHSVLHTITGARVVSSRGPDLSFDTGRTKAYVVDRGALDREMIEKAACAGADTRLKCAFAGFGTSGILTRGMNGRQELSYRVLIAADGPRSSIARALGMARAPVYLSGIQADAKLEKNPALVELHPDASAEFFGWIIPTGKDRVRVGLCGMEHVRERFFSFLHSSGAKGCINLVTGTIPLGVMPRTYGHRTLFVGDAAGFAKPTSGGGVYTGVRSARYAAATALDACESGDTGDRSLSRYETLWKNDMGRELSLGFRLFRMRQAMTPDDLEKLIRVLSDPEIIEEIKACGDMDRPGILVRRLLKNPRIFPLFRVLVRSGVRGIIK